MNSEIPVTINSMDKQLIGILHRNESDGAIVMCHGFTGNKMEKKRLFVEAARSFSKEGYTVLRFDFFGSGDSEGEFRESRISHNIANLEDTVHWLRERGYEKLAVLGLSMGAATAILTAHRISSNALITWSAVPDMRLLFKSYLDRREDLSPETRVYEHDGWLIEKAFMDDAVKYDIKGALSGIEIPKLIIQGSEDAPLFVQGFKDFQDVVVPPADFMEIPGAGHTYQTAAHRLQVIRQTLVWLKRHF